MAKNPEFDRVLAEMGATHDRKNDDYADQENPYSNFENAAFMAAISTGQGFLYLLGIKLERLRQLVSEDRAPNNESVDDTILDVAVYAALWLAHRRSIHQYWEAQSWEFPYDLTVGPGGVQLQFDLRPPSETVTGHAGYWL